MDLSKFRTANLARNAQVFPRELEEWTAADWCIAMAGECGEVCNAVKKLRRIDEGTNTAKDPQTKQEAINEIAREMADVFCYMDLLAAKLGIDLSLAVMGKFNEVSDRMKSTVKIYSLE